METVVENVSVIRYEGYHVCDAPHILYGKPFRRIVLNNDLILPFYMLYPYTYDEQERRMQDLEYLQQLYPKEAKRILKKVMYHLEPIDYNGSFLYDEYPDQLMMYRVVAGILDEIKKEAETEGIEWSKEKELWMQDMIKLVMYLEVFKRRCRKKPI